MFDQFLDMWLPLIVLGLMITTGLVAGLCEHKSILHETDDSWSLLPRLLRSASHFDAKGRGYQVAGRWALVLCAVLALVAGLLDQLER